MHRRGGAQQAMTPRGIALIALLAVAIGATAGALHLAPSTAADAGPDDWRAVDFPGCLALAAQAPDVSSAYEAARACFTMYPEAPTLQKAPERPGI